MTDDTDKDEAEAMRSRTASGTWATAWARMQSDTTIEKAAPGISITPAAAASGPRPSARSNTGHSPARSR